MTTQPEVIEFEVTPAPDVIEVIEQGPRGQPGTDGSDGTDGADGVSVTGALIDGYGHLLITLSVGDLIDVGLVVGSNGVDGADGVDGANGSNGDPGVSIVDAVVNGSGHLILYLSSLDTIDSGLVVGADGISIVDAAVDGSYHLILTLSDTSTIDAGYVRGPAGADGSGSGDVVGPAAAVDSNFAAYDTTTGKLIKDSGSSASSFATSTQGGKADTAVQPGDTHAASSKATPVDADEIPLQDSAASYALKKLTWANLKATAKTYFDTLYQATSARLTDIAALTATDSNIIVGNGTTWVAESGATARTSLGLGTGDSPQFTAVNIGHASDTTLTRVSAGVVAVEGSNVLLASGLGSVTQAYDADLAALAALSTTGMMARTAANTYTMRTITGTANQVTVSNGTGVSADPTISLPTVAQPYGTQAIWVPAGAMIPRTTNGAASGTAETTTNKVMISTLDFDNTTQEFAQFSIRMPKSWNESTVTFSAVWSHAGTTTNFGVVWQLQGLARGDSDALDTAFGTEQTSTDTGGTTDDIWTSPTSSAITIAGTPAAEDLVIFQVARDPANGSDNLAIDARLHGVTVYITTDAGNDA